VEQHLAICIQVEGGQFRKLILFQTLKLIIIHLVKLIVEHFKGKLILYIVLHFTSA